MQTILVAGTGFSMAWSAGTAINFTSGTPRVTTPTHDTCHFGKSLRIPFAAPLNRGQLTFLTTPANHSELTWPRCRPFWSSTKLQPGHPAIHPLGDF